MLLPKIWYNCGMFRIVYIALLAFAYILSAQASPRVVRTIPEAKNLSHAEFQSNLPFELEGQIVLINERKRFILEKDGERVSLFRHPSDATPLSVKKGDIVVMKGHAETVPGNRERLPLDTYDRLRIESAEVIGHKDPPAPELATIGEILSGVHDLKSVIVRGEIASLFKDEIDADWYYCTLCEGDKFIYLTINSTTIDPNLAKALVGSTIETTGFCSSIFGLRRFMRPGVKVEHPNSIRIIKPAPDPFSVPELGTITTLPIDDVVRMGRRKTCGRVLTAWGGNRILVKTPDGGIVRADLALGSNLPPPGSPVCVAGTVATDFFHLNLEEAVVRAEPEDSLSVEPPPVLDEKRFVFRMRRKLKNKVIFLGDTVRVSGTVNRILHMDDSNVRIDLDAKRMRITAEANLNRIPLEGIEPGCRVELTGTFVTDGDNWQPNAPIPRIGDWSLVVNEPGDIRILARPSWWTARRLVALIAILIIVLAASFALIYALGLIANRRGRKLYQEQMRLDERTRLAAELHDSLSQNLSGIACQINVAKLTAGDDETKGILSTTERMLQSCRTELTRCISDLRCNALEDPDFCATIRQNLKMLALPTSIEVTFDIPRAAMSDTTAHSILCIVRELVTNAVRHGKASFVKVAGNIEKHRISFSVTDNGCGFDVAHRPGVQSGHFGLEGVKDRVNRLDGTFEMSSSPQNGTVAKISIPLSSHRAKEVPGT